MTLPAMNVTSLSFKSPGSAIGDTYAILGDWIVMKQYHITGPSIETYSKRPEVVDGLTILYTRIMLPFEPKDAHTILMSSLSQGRG